MQITDSYQAILSPLKRVLVVLAHPDDMEINCGGVMARLREDGKLVRLVVTTNGDKGTKDKTIDAKVFGRQRVEEQKKAGKILGIPDSDNFNLNLSDGEVETSLENISKIVFHVRDFKPDLIITHNPQDVVIDFYERSKWVNHRDHRNTGLITLDAVYPYSRDRGFFPEQLTNGLKEHTATKILFTDSYVKSTVKYFSVDQVLEKKREALKQHVSAFSSETADDYIDENLFGENHFEPLGYYEVY